MKGYWINQVVEVKDPNRFKAYADASLPMFSGNNRYGATLKFFAPVEKTVVGGGVQFVAVIEFNSVQDAIDFWDDPEYAAARALMGDDESAVVERRVCCIEGDEFDVSPGQGVWVNHVHEIVEQEAFFTYADASMPNFEAVSYGPVVHQHAGAQATQLAAVLILESKEKALSVYDAEAYRAARTEGGMLDDEAPVVRRTVCALGL